MTRRSAISMFMSALGAGAALAENRNLHPDFGDNPLFGRNDPSKYMSATYPHGGPGTVSYMELTPRDLLTSQFLFLHRGVLGPKSGLGEHVHRRMEEMYFILEGTAEFTVNGCTSELPGPAMALCPMGSSHGIYNPHDEPIEFMNIGVTLEDRRYDALDFAKQNDLANRTLESPPRFMWGTLDTRLLRPVQGFYSGKGVMYKRTVWSTDTFKTKWGFVNHYMLPPGNSIGYHRHHLMEEVYYILSGTGRMTVDDATHDVRAGDAATCPLHSAHGFYNNSGSQTELLSIAVPLKKGVYDGDELGDDLTAR